MQIRQPKYGYMSRPESSQQTVTKFNTNASKNLKATRLHIRASDFCKIAIPSTLHLGYNNSS